MRASPHVAVPRVTRSPPPRTTPDTLSTLPRRVNPPMMTSASLATLARAFAGRIFYVAQETERVVSVGGSVDSARRRSRLADSRRRSTSERTGAADSPRLASASPRLASRYHPLPARLFAATCTRDSYLFAAADTPRCSLWCFHSSSYRLLVCTCVYTCARANVYACMFDYSHAPLPIPCRLSTSHAPGISFETVRSFLSLFCSHRMRFLVRLVRLLSVESSTRDENDDQLVLN